MHPPDAFYLANHGSRCVECVCPWCTDVMTATLTAMVGRTPAARSGRVRSAVASSINLSLSGVNSIAGVTLHFHRIKPVKAGGAADAEDAWGNRDIYKTCRRFSERLDHVNNIELYHHSVSNTRAGELSYPYN
eukprot:CAMPEP_0198684208 /NCGR_PEP_ID=MMETSP1468-20131203/11864_1 /TAXON_ID=1461545 /ORGANISM="Mantoniella sp, Strain CCMP1436" /LENGTH=132 /DNA_ID=CAMNT_0044428849 /DNA_START=250 /DNA_END=649 /DNA_ORIENTATION=-